MVVTSINTTTAKEIGVVADAFRKAYVDVAVDDGPVRQNVLALDKKEVVFAGLGQYVRINWFDVPTRLVIGVGVHDSEYRNV